MPNPDPHQGERVTLWRCSSSGALTDGEHSDCPETGMTSMDGAGDFIPDSQHRQELEEMIELVEGERDEIVQRIRATEDHISLDAYMMACGEREALTRLASLLRERAER